MPFQAFKCTVDYNDGKYNVSMSVRYLDAQGNIIGQVPVGASVAKSDNATMRAALVAALRPLLDSAVAKLKEDELGTGGLAANITTQVNNYLATK